MDVQGVLRLRGWAELFTFCGLPGLRVVRYMHVVWSFFSSHVQWYLGGKSAPSRIVKRLVVRWACFTSGRQYLIEIECSCEVPGGSIVSPSSPSSCPPSISPAVRRQRGHPHERCGGLGRPEGGRASPVRGTDTVAHGHYFPRHFYAGGLPLIAHRGHVYHLFWGGGIAHVGFSWSVHALCARKLNVLSYTAL